MALVELIKNSYDADATEVIVYGENLDKPSRGRIVISDNGIGMTPEIFEKGFLRIASRVKEQGDRRSPFYKRRYTGAKGVGRLAAQKLAWRLSVLSVPDPDVMGDKADAVGVTIDWLKIDACETLDEPGVEGAIKFEVVETDHVPGTEIELTNLRRKWTARERSRVIREVTTFQPPPVLLDIPAEVCNHDLLLDTLDVSDVAEAEDPGFAVRLDGDFDVGEEYWAVAVNAADWILEIRADHKKNTVEYLITPSTALLRQFPNAGQHEFHWNDPPLEFLPSVNVRILIREGPTKGIERLHRRWLVESSGVRVYMEGFRVLPYGEPGDDWLEIDSDYAQRARTLRFLNDADLDISRFGDTDEDFGLLALRNTSYFGAVFLTKRGTPDLEMLVNREGFIPNASFLTLQRLVRIGIDLSVRARAFEKQGERRERRHKRAEGSTRRASETPRRMKVREAAEESAQKASDLALKARAAGVAGKHKQAEKLITSAVREIERSARFAGELITDRSIMQVLAGVGLQMSAFVHELNALLGMASAVEAAVNSLREKLRLDPASRKPLAKLIQGIADLRRVVERQASYLADITSPDTRRRRSRQKLRERFQANVHLVQRAAEKRRIEIENRLPQDLMSPPMFAAEIMIIYSNLVANAIKACERNGRVQVTGGVGDDGRASVIIQNTGTRVNLADAEKWFLPFKSTTVEADPLLGQGMGMGLPIVRNVLEEYGAEVGFVKPSKGFTTAVAIVF